MPKDFIPKPYETFIRAEGDTVICASEMSIGMITTATYTRRICNVGGPTWWTVSHTLGEPV